MEHGAVEVRDHSPHLTIQVLPLFPPVALHQYKFADVKIMSSVLTNLLTMAARAHPKAAKRAETEPPPGAGVLSPTLRTKSATVFLTSRSEPGSSRQYSMILSLTEDSHHITGNINIPNFGLKGDSVDSPSLLMAR